MELEFWGETDVGKQREHNEDNFLIDKKLKLFIVADGMGGHQAGEIASSVAVKEVRRVIYENKDVIETLERTAEKDKSRDGKIADRKDILFILEHAVQQASSKIYSIAEKDSSRKGMGTTLSLLLVIGSHGYIGHVGDSRIYLVRNKEIHGLTEDHSVLNILLQMGKLNRDNVSNFPYKNAITRAVGVYESVQVDTYDFDILPNDAILICSDGLSGYFTGEQDILSVIDNSDLRAATKQFVNFANESGGKDNVTVVIVRSKAESEISEDFNLKLEALKHTVLLKDLTYKELIKIANIVAAKTYSKDDLVIREGEVGDSLFIILKGLVEVSKQAIPITRLGNGCHFGEMALIDSCERSATVKCVEPSKILEITRKHFFEIIKSDYSIATKFLWNFVQVLSYRLRNTMHEVVSQKDLEMNLDTACNATLKPIFEPTNQDNISPYLKAEKKKAD